MGGNFTRRGTAALAFGVISLTVLLVSTAVADAASPNLRLSNVLGGSGSGGSDGPAAPPPAASSTLAVSVSGNQLIDGSGQPLVLTGVNRGDTWPCWYGKVFDGPVDQAAANAIRSWGANVVRIQVTEDCWLGINGAPSSSSGQVYRDEMVAWANRLHAAGMYVIVEVHWSAPGTVQSRSHDRMLDADHGVDLWTSIANAFAGDRAVLFELYNEPNDISWECWRDGCTVDGTAYVGMQTLVDAIRATGSTQPILLTGLDWGNDLRGWIAHRPVDPASALVAAGHVYNYRVCSDRLCWDGNWGPVANEVPLVLTEIGEDTCGASMFLSDVVGWAELEGVSYLAWKWDTRPCSGRGNLGMLVEWDGTPNSYGLWFREHLTSRARG